MGYQRACLNNRPICLKDMHVWWSGVYIKYNQIPTGNCSVVLHPLTLTLEPVKHQDFPWYCHRDVFTPALSQNTHRETEEKSFPQAIRALTQSLSDTRQLPTRAERWTIPAPLPLHFDTLTLAILHNKICTSTCLSSFNFIYIYNILNFC
jgi:hypothetical protein